MRRDLRSLLCTAAAVTLVACGQGIDGSEIEQLRADLSERERREAAMLERLEDVEEELAEVTAVTSQIAEGTGGIDDRFDALGSDLERLGDALGDLEEELATGRAQQDELAADLASATSDLRGSVDTIRRSTDELAGEVDELRTLYLTLRDRLDRSQQ